MRDIDRLIELVCKQNYLPIAHRQVIINRLDPRPTDEELRLAKSQLEGNDWVPQLYL